MSALLDRGGDDEIGPILYHLRDLLNSRHGGTPAQPHYGLPDSNDLLQYPGSPARLMCRAIRDCLDRYEPRLQVLDIHEQRSERNPVQMSFLIRARLHGRVDEAPLLLETALNIGGHVTVRRYE